MSANASGSANPKAFASYSWDSEDHKAWVKGFAGRLRSHGVDVTLDRWAVAPGDQLTRFMETAVRENDFVLIICTPNYKRKSDTRQGGVGYEGDIMTGEVLNGQNPKKFIPILREGDWKTAAPSWLASRFYVNLRGDPYPEDMYEVLLHNLYGTTEQPPPLGTRPPPRNQPGVSGNRETSAPSVADIPMGPIKIRRIVLDEIGVPRWDGTAGSALYTVPFLLSRRPSAVWVNYFLQTWNHPPSFTLMHRPHIARIVGDRLILEGTTVDEIEKYHRDTLKGVLDKVNTDVAEHEEKQRREDERRAEMLRQHKQSVEEAAKRIRFD